MRQFIFYLIIKISYSITPIWNFSNSAQDLFSQQTSISYVITEKIWWQSKIQLIKKLEKINNTITEKNYFKINDLNEIETNWENIESFYYIENRYFICPTGTNYLTEYKDEKLIIHKPDPIEGNWELLCYYQHRDYSWMFTGYLNSMNPGKLYGFNLNHNSFTKLEIHTSILDFIWHYEPFQNDDYAMIGVIIKDGTIKLAKMTITISDSINWNGGDEIFLSNDLGYSRSYFNNLNYFYWISYKELNFVS